MTYDLITILGPTASGKTPLAAALAHRLHTEIISGDSRQVYRRMDLGTGKDLADYVVDGHRIPYHLIDIAEPGTKYNVFEFQHDFLQAYEDIRSRGKLPVLCGGTGMYLESVLKGYKLLPVPENPALRERLAGKSLEELTVLLSTYKTLHNSTDVDTVKRAIRAIEIEEYYRTQPVGARDFPEIHSLIIGVDIDRDLRREMFRQLEIAIHQFAKRQMTWFRGMERRGFTIHWIDATRPLEEKVEEIMRLLDTNQTEYP